MQFQNYSQELLSTRRSKHNNNLFQNPFKLEKQNRPSNEPIKPDQNKKSRFGSSNSQNTSKQRSLSSKYKNKILNDKIKEVRQFDLNYKESTKRSKSNKNKLSKKAKSMIKLPKYGQKNIIQEDRSKICRKSYSPNRNYSEGLKRTNPNNVNYRLSQYSTQCIKTTKFSQSKDATVKHQKSIKTDRILKKDPSQLKPKLTKSKEKIKSRFASVKNLQDPKNYETDRKKEELFSKIDADKARKLNKKQSPSKKNDNLKKKTEEKNYKLVKEKDKMVKKKIKSMSKSKKNIHFESVDEMLLRQQNYQTSQNEGGRLSNYLSSRNSLRKKMKTDRDSLNGRPKKRLEGSSKQKQKDKEVIVSSKNLNKLRNQAATTIQKVYKGYITRKWLRQYLKIISAVVVIQKFWRSYLARKKCRPLIEKARQKKLKQVKTINPRIDPIIQEERSRQISFEDSKINIHKWKDILFEVMEQKTVNQALKSKIKHFLQAQTQSARNSMASQKSHRSRNSEQILQEEIMSERRYFQKKMVKKDSLSSSRKKARHQNSPNSFSAVQQNDFASICSPTHRRSSLMSPQVIPISPKLRRAQSPQQIIQNLHDIQNYQKQNIMLQAKSRKRELQQMVKRNACSPRSYQIKQKEIDHKMEQALKNFEQNIKGVITSCKQSTHFIGQAISMGSFNDDSLMMTPQHSSVRQSLAREDFQNLSQNQVMSKLFEKVQEQIPGQDLIKEVQQQIEFKDAKSVKIEISPSEDVPTYENFQTFNVNALSSQKQEPQKAESSQKMNKVDTSCNFLDEYLLTMIEYMRNKNEGKVMEQIVKGVKTWRNLEPIMVLRNLSVVNDDNNTEEDGFGLPLYKYLQDDSDIIKQQYVNDYNKYFNMMKQSHKFQPPSLSKNQSKYQQRENQAYQHYLKLLIDSFNEALNLKRPNKFIFTDKAIESFNSKMLMDRQLQDVESEYDMYCAGAMHQIFNWLNVKYGCIVSVNEEQTSMEQVMIRDSQRLKLLIKMEAQKKWDEYYQKIQTLAKVDEEIFEDLIIKETITILNIERKFLKERELFR